MSSRTNDKTLAVFDYHERTKHRPGRYARSPGFMDWENEPVPFRTYEGAALLSLPLADNDPDAAYLGLYERSSAFRSFTLANIALFLELSLGLSAWKVYGRTSWALRMNPSSGNLHPTEAHLILPPLAETGGEAGVYHYNPFLHALQKRAVVGGDLWEKLRAHFSADGFFVGLSSIYWRESWKYGERAFRYCQQDVGHAAACLSFAGNLSGWRATYLNALSDDDLQALFCFRDTEWPAYEEEHPDLLLFLHRDSGNSIARAVPEDIVAAFRSLNPVGKPNQLSKEHQDWQVIDAVSAAASKPATPEASYNMPLHPFFSAEPVSRRATEIIRRRRSAQAFDGLRSSLTKDALLSILDKTLPRGNAAPFDMELGETSVHLLLFIHRVSGMDPGLYFLLRHERDLQELRKRCRPDLLWETVEGSPSRLHLFLLEKADFRDKAATAG